MRVYFNPKSIGSRNTQQLIEQFPSVEFITDEKDAYLSNMICIMPNFFAYQQLNQFHHLKFVQLLMAGYDGVDLSFFEEKEIVVSNAVDIFSKSIAEDVMTKIFVFNRNVKYYFEKMKECAWSPIRKEPELTGSVAGILGTGSIGKETAKRLKSFDVKVIGYRTKQEEVPFFDEIYTGDKGLEKVISSSDYLIVALPLNDDTLYLLNEKRLSMMKENSLLINVARGQIIDQDALVKILREKRIRGAALDVMYPEPLPKDHPLWKLDNVYLTPHNASSSPYMQNRLKDLIAHNLTHYLQGIPVDYVISHKKSASE